MRLRVGDGESEHTRDAAVCGDVTARNGTKVHTTADSPDPPIPSPQGQQ